MAKKIRIVGQNTSPEVQTGPDRQYVNLPLDDIRPSKTNRTIDTTSEAFEGLVESIKVQGLIQAIKVRHEFDEEGTQTGKYVIVAGERRWAAFKKLGLPTIPSEVSDLTDSNANALQLTENLHRTDLRLMEKVRLITEYKTSHNLSNSDVARELAMKPRDVSDLICMAGLLPAAYPLAESGVLTKTMVNWVARMNAPQQEKAIRAIFRNAMNPESDTRGWYDRDKWDFADFVAYVAECTPAQAKAMTEKEFRSWRTENITQRLADAQWDLADANLVPEAGPCTTCPQRSINDPEKYAEVSDGKDLCMNPACYALKGKTLVKITVSAKREEAKEQGEKAQIVRISTAETHTRQKEGATSLKKNQWVAAPKGKCEGITTALVTDGPEAGKEQRVCTDPDCKVHQHHGLWNNHAPASAETEEEKQAKEEARAAKRNARQSAIDNVLSSRPSMDLLLRMFLVDAVGNAWSGDKTWQAISSTFGWGEIPEGYGKASPFLLHHLSQLPSEDLATAAVLYHLIEHVEESHNDREFARKLTVLGVDAEQLAALGITPGTGNDDDEDDDNDDLGVDNEDDSEGEDSESDSDAETSGGEEAPAPGRPNRSLSPEARKRIQDAMKKRWAERGIDADAAVATEEQDEQGGEE